MATNWREIADRLAERLSHHAACDEHSRLTEAQPDTCPFCADRAALLAYDAAAHPARPTDYLVLDMDEGVLRRERTRAAALQWFQDHQGGMYKVRERHTYGPGQYSYVVGWEGGDAHDTASVFIERADVAAASSWKPEQTPLYPHRLLPFEYVEDEARRKWAEDEEPEGEER